MQPTPPHAPIFEGISFGYVPRAAYASKPEDSRGRVFAETGSPTRAPFQRDRDRIIHSTAFRRLTHKTQVFFSQEADLYRTRLTHSIEVSQIARALARALRLDEELAEAIALAHDFGHTPFGHAGERALNRAMQPFGGFDHNAQSLRIVTKMEQRYANFDGLNLSFETLDGLIKHNGPIKGKIPQDIALFDQAHGLALHEYSCMEAQVAAIADDIAYNAHDLEDGLHSGLLTLDHIESAPLAGDLLRDVRKLHPDLSPRRTAYEITRRQITRMVEDVIGVAQSNIKRLAPQSHRDIRTAPAAYVQFSAAMAQQEKGLKQFLFQHLYRHEQVMATMKDAEIITEKLFAAYMDKPSHLPEDWQKRPSEAEPLPIHVKDFIAGMTDRFATREYERIIGPLPKSFLP